MATKQKQPRDPVKNLDVVAQFISPYVAQALQASMVELYVMGLFSSNKEHYAGHPMNSMHGSALHALQQQSLVHIDAVLQSPVLQPLPVKVRRKFDLMLHRNKIAHPLEVKWRKAMSKFINEKRDLYDYKPALIWDMQRSVNDELRQRGMRVHNEAVSVTWDMAVMTEVITRAALKPESAHRAVPAADLLPYLRRFAPRYLLELEKMPDGRRKPPAATSASAPAAPAT
jgi:hypothetical protein